MNDSNEGFFMNEIFDWIDYNIHRQNELLDNASRQPLPDMKSRTEGFLEALYQVREFLNSSKLL